MTVKISPTGLAGITLDLSVRGVKILEHLLNNEIVAHKNWIASAVEAGIETSAERSRAARLVRDLRRLEGLVASLRGSFREQRGVHLHEVDDFPTEV